MGADQITGNDGPPRSYTASELERETGFDRRTIAYYVQEELLPKVGRRGPRTRYPKLARDRLLFIKKVREEEEAGGVGPVSLSDMREIFNRVPLEVIADVADGREPLRIVALAGVGGARRRTEQPAGFERRRETLKRRLAARQARHSYDMPAYDAPGEFEGPYPDPAPDQEGVMYCRVPPQESEERPASMAFSVPERASAERSADSPRDPAPSWETKEETELGDALAELQEVARRRRQDSSRPIDTWSQITISPDITLSVRGAGDEDAGLMERVRQNLRRLIARRF